MQMPSAPLRWLRLDETGSTNADAKHLVLQGELDCGVVQARLQRAGRGRLERRWESPVGGLYLSLVGPSPEPQVSPLWVTVAVGVALVEELAACCGVAAKLRWPNDLMVEGRKLAGMLSERVVGLDGKARVIVGIGLNDRTPVRLSDSDTETTCLSAESQQTYDDLAERLVPVLWRAWRELDEASPAILKDRWIAVSETIGETVCVRLMDNREIVGQAVDLAYDFGLVVYTETGPVTLREGDCRRLR